MTAESNLILSIPEFRLSLNVLGYSQWDDLPVVATAEPAEQRMMNAFLRLIQGGYFLPTEGGYRPEPEFERQILSVGQAEQVWHLYHKDQIMAFLYGKGSNIAAVSPDWGNPEYCRIWLFCDAAPEDLTEWFAGQTDSKEQLWLCPAEPNAQRGIYDTHKLSLFYGNHIKTEETE